MEDTGKEFLHLAENGSVEQMKSMLLRNPDVLQFQDSDGYMALHRASYSDQPGTVKFLLSQGADISARTLDGWTPLHSACRWNSYKCVVVLLENGADINAKTEGGLVPLHVAAENSIARQTLIILLLNPNVDVTVTNASGETPAVIAAQHGSLAYLFELVRKSLLYF